MTSRLDPAANKFHIGRRMGNITGSRRPICMRDWMRSFTSTSTHARTRCPKASTA